MIPKVIHYCWFGKKPLPELAIKCIQSWKKFLPDYEIKEWNESNFNVNIIPYTQEAYQAGRYAFVSDYARFWILYKYGGIYFDTDVQMIKPMEEIINKGPFMGCENDSILSVAPGLGLGVNPQNPLYKEILDSYTQLHFLLEDGSYNQTTVVTYITEILVKHGLQISTHIQQCAGIYIYPKEYFCPKDFLTSKITITPNTVTIHHYDGTWLTEDIIYMRKLAKRLGNNRLGFYIAGVVMQIKFHGIIATLKYCLGFITKRI